MLRPRYGDEALAALRQMSTNGILINTNAPLLHHADLVVYNPLRRNEVAPEKRIKAWWTDSPRRAKPQFRDGTLPGDTLAAGLRAAMRQGGALDQGAG
ncbi:hypothetical protein ACCO45_007804 [Purpureocillium lilacinum]|uniref:Uncharacterized protein n=1 Tax=Purpureocillium lilacinum TaxID=33203 RepID=A0ACC4DLJ2_PURLI